MEGNTSSKEMDTLTAVQTLVQLEQSLTATLEKTKPLLSLPTPTSLPQAELILALARTYSTRTSAPPGWNPSLPVAHFATPSPYPHQLRGGALGALQLQMVKEERLMKKRKRIEEAKAKEREARLKLEKKKAGDAEFAKDPKKKEIAEHEDAKNRMRRQQQQQQQQKAKEQSMNLSSSSSSEEESESEEED